MFAKQHKQKVNPERIRAFVCKEDRPFVTMLRVANKKPHLDVVDCSTVLSVFAGRKQLRKVI